MEGRVPSGSGAKDRGTETPARPGARGTCAGLLTCGLQGGGGGSLEGCGAGIALVQYTLIPTLGIRAPPSASAQPIIGRPVKVPPSEMFPGTQLATVRVLQKPQGFRAVT